MVHDDTYMAVPTVSPVDCATPYEADLKHELNAKCSYLSVEDNLPTRFEVNNDQLYEQTLSV